MPRIEAYFAPGAFPRYWNVVFQSWQPHAYLKSEIFKLTIDMDGTFSICYQISPAVPCTESMHISNLLIPWKWNHHDFGIASSLQSA